MISPATCTTVGPWPCTVAPRVTAALVVAVGAFVAVDCVLRDSAALWWQAVGQATSALWPLVDGLGLAATLACLVGMVKVSRGWPRAPLVLATAAIMQPVGIVLAFGFHDAELAAAWSCVHLAALALVGVFAVLRAPPNVRAGWLRPLWATATLSSLAVAASMLQAAQLVD